LAKYSAEKSQLGFLDVLNPLALFAKPFEDFICRFFTIEVSESSRELEALIYGGHVLVL
jgi:hypothetical protein